MNFTILNIKKVIQDNPEHEWNIQSEDFSCENEALLLHHIYFTPQYEHLIDERKVAMKFFIKETLLTLIPSMLSSYIKSKDSFIDAFLQHPKVQAKNTNNTVYNTLSEQYDTSVKKSIEIFFIHICKDNTLNNFVFNKYLKKEINLTQDDENFIQNFIKQNQENLFNLLKTIAETEQNFIYDDESPNNEYSSERGIKQITYSITNVKVSSYPDVNFFYLFPFSTLLHYHETKPIVAEIIKSIENKTLETLFVEYPYHYNVMKPQKNSFFLEAFSIKDEFNKIYNNVDIDNIQTPQYQQLINNINN